MKCKDMEDKDSETKVEKTWFIKEVPISETRNEEHIEVPSSSYRERKPTIALGHDLACDLVKERIPPQRHIYVNISCYDLNMAEGL